MLTHLQGEIRLRQLQRQAKLLSPLLGAGLETLGQGLDPNAAGRWLFAHQSLRSKILRIGKQRPIKTTVRYFARAERRPRKMSDILPLTIGVLPTHNHYGLRNTQALAGVSHVWQDFFARALAEQLGDTPDALAAKAPAPVDPAVEPSEGADLLSHLLNQRECDVKDTEIAPPEPLFLPIA